MLKMLLLNLALLMSVQKEYGMPLKQIDFRDITERQPDYLSVEMVVSESNGTGGGYDEHGYIAYNAVVPQGDTVMSFVVYNPSNQECDDILYVIDNGEIR